MCYQLLSCVQVYRILGQTVVFFPTDYNVDFYISFDVMMLIDLFTVSLSIVLLRVVLLCGSAMTSNNAVHI